MRMNKGNELAEQFTDAIHDCMLKYQCWSIHTMFCRFHTKFGSQHQNHQEQQLRKDIFY